MKQDFINSYVIDYEYGQTSIDLSTEDKQAIMHAIARGDTQGRIYHEDLPFLTWAIKYSATTGYIDEQNYRHAGYDEPFTEHANTLESCEVTIKVDLKALREQKKELIEMMEYFRSMQEYNVFRDMKTEGLLSLIDAIQDQAVADNGFDEKDVFDLDTEG